MQWFDVLRGGRASRVRWKTGAMCAVGQEGSSLLRWASKAAVLRAEIVRPCGLLIAGPRRGHLLVSRRHGHCRAWVLPRRLLLGPNTGVVVVDRPDLHDHLTQQVKVRSFCFAQPYHQQTAPGTPSSARLVRRLGGARSAPAASAQTGCSAMRLCNFQTADRRLRKWTRSLPHWQHHCRTGNSGDC